MSNPSRLLFRLIECCLFLSGINILGVVENMSDIKISFSSLLQPDTGVKLVNEQGDDITGNVLQT